MLTSTLHLVGLINMFDESVDFGLLALYTLRGYLCALHDDKKAFELVGQLGQRLGSEHVFTFRPYIVFKALEVITKADFSSPLNEIIEGHQLTETMIAQLDKIVQTVVVPLLTDEVSYTEFLTKNMS